MKTIKKIGFFILSLILSALFLTGCAVQEDKSFIKKGLARIKVVSQNGSGEGSVTCTIVAVDGEYLRVDSNNQKYITILPGHHEISFKYYKMTSRGGGMRISLSVFGNSTDLVSPKPEVGLESTQNIDIKGSFVAGKSYFIDSSSLRFEPIQNDIYSISGLGFGQYEMKGRARVKEEIN